MMQEITSQVFMETGFAGVTLGAINWPHGLILIDSPFRADDVRSWRSALLNLGGGVERLLINLDAHPDRTLGVRAMECTILAQEKVAQVFHNRPLSFKSQSIETGADWELASNLGSVRWAPPELTFTNHLHIFWDDQPIRVEYHPGSATGSSWVVLPRQQVVFAGDSVVVNQPPFLATADLPLWMEQLEALLSDEYREYIVVAGRGGLASYRDIRNLLTFLRKTHERVEKLAAQNAPVEQMAPLSTALLADFDPPEGRETQFRQRLLWGLRQYYLRHYQPNSSEIIEE